MLHWYLVCVLLHPGKTSIRNLTVFDILAFMRILCKLSEASLSVFKISHLELSGGRKGRVVSKMLRRDSLQAIIVSDPVPTF